MELIDKKLPTRGKRIQWEDVECEMFATWMKMRGIPFTHVANEEARRNRVRNERMGTSIGFPDYVVFTPQGVVFIEMKSTQKYVKASPEQLAWIEIANKTPGTEGKVCFGFEQARDYVSEFL